MDHTIPPSYSVWTGENKEKGPLTLRLHTDGLTRREANEKAKMLRAQRSSSQLVVGVYSGSEYHSCF